MAISEVGTPGGIRAEFDFAGKPYYAPDPAETTVELLWPLSVAVYDSMRRTDSQISGNLRAMTMPILSANWQLDTVGVRPAVVSLITTELGLNLNKNQARQRRRRNGIVWKDHLRTALLAPIFGHMAFEQVYEIGPPTKEQEGVGLDTIAHLRKLAPRFPRTISEIHVAQDGGLAGITQLPISHGLQTYKPVFIGVERLVYYCIEREGGDWTGTSVLRPTYKHWMIRDVLIRLAAQIVERNGMGVPDLTYDGIETTKEQAEALVRGFRAGATGGMARSLGTTFQLVGVSGSTVDPIPHINYHDQAISKAMLAMFLDLGHDTGARSLGETFVDFFTASLQAVADEIAETATEHIIRDLVEENFGPDEPYPVLTAGNLSEQQAVAAETLTSLTAAGLITPDGKLEGHLRTRYGLPDVDIASRPAPPPVAAGVGGDGDGDGSAGDSGKITPLPGTRKVAAPLAAVEKTAASGELDILGYAETLMARIRESVGADVPSD